MDSIDRERIRTTLDFDGLATAEKVTGSSYKEDDETRALGLALHMMGGDSKRQVMAETHDTHYSMEWSYCRSVIADMGFTIGHVGKFVGTNGQAEEFLLAYSTRGLVFAESYNWPDRSSTNSVRFFFNWRRTDPDWWPSHCSGGFDSDAYAQGDHVYVGDIHGIEGLRFRITEMDEHGHFITPWIAHRWVSLQTYAESRALSGASYDERREAQARINAERLALLGEAGAPFRVE